MSLSFHGPKGTIEQRWIYYALLRDNVQHHIEGGQPTAEFEGLHSISEALVRHRVTVPALKLRGELQRAREALSGRPLSDLAVSLRTRAVLSLRWPPPDERETVLVSEWGGTIPLLGEVGPTLDDVFGHLLDHLLGVIGEPAEGDVVTVVDL